MAAGGYPPSVTVTPGPQVSETLSPVLADIDPAEQGRTAGQLATRQICPFLAIDGGGWRSSNPSRDHRCGAVTPAVPLAIDKQRRLCLADAHVLCSTYLAATGASPSGESVLAGAATAGRPGAAATPTVTRWSLVRTVPVVLDRGRVPSSVGAIARDRRGGQLALAGLLVAAFAAVAVARLSGGDGSNLLGAMASGSPSASARITTAPATPTPVATVALTPLPSVPPSAPPSTAPTPTPTPEHQTYTVVSGDSLTAIARRFGTTVDALAELNDIAAADRNKLYVGQVLLIP
jgi:hypothetical protein